MSRHRRPTRQQVRQVRAALRVMFAPRSSPVDGCQDSPACCSDVTGASRCQADLGWKPDWKADFSRYGLGKSRNTPGGQGGDDFVSAGSGGNQFGTFPRAR